MTTISAMPDPKRKWYGLALRHLRMASRLLDSGFADGTVFHAYHAYGCVLSALIAAKGYPVPPDGKTQTISPRASVKK
jgi:HEPN domain-containing protein